MRFAIRGRSVAPAPSASAVADRECQALFRGEQALLASEVERIAVSVDRALDGADFAGVLRDQPGRDGGLVVFGQPYRGPAVRLRRARCLRDEHPYACLLRPEDRRRVGERSGAHHVEEQVVGELIVRARIGHEILGAGLLGRVDEPWATAPRPEGAVEDGLQPGAAQVVEDDGAVANPVGIGPQAERPPLEPLVEAAFGAFRVELVPDGAGSAGEFFDRPLGGLGGKLLGRQRPHLRDVLRGRRVVNGRRLAKPAENHIVLRGGDRPVEERAPERCVPRRRRISRGAARRLTRHPSASRIASDARRLAAATRRAARA